MQHVLQYYAPSFFLTKHFFSCVYSSQVDFSIIIVTYIDNTRARTRTFIINICHVSTTLIISALRMTHAH